MEEEDLNDNLVGEEEDDAVVVEGNEDLSDEQLKYAASDVLYLHKLKYELDIVLKRENRQELAETLFRFIGTKAYLDLNGWHEPDIFNH